MLSESAGSGPAAAADPDEFKVTLEVVEVVEAAAAAAFSAANLASRSSFFF